LNLLSNSEHWLRWLVNLGGHSGSDHKDKDGQESSEQRGKRVVHTTVLVNLDNLVNQPPNQVNPRQGGGEGKPSDDSVERLRLEFRGDERDSFFGGRHFLYYKCRFYSGRKFSSNKIFLYFFVFLKYPFIFLIGFSLE